MTEIEIDVSRCSEDVLFTSPLLAALHKTLLYLDQNAPVGLTKKKALKRHFVHWAAKEFNWPHLGYDELFSVNKVLHEFDFLPLEVVHYTLRTYGFARPYNGALEITKKGKAILNDPRTLFMTTVPTYTFDLDHSALHWNRERPVGNWNVWLNVLNITLNEKVCATDIELYEQFYGHFDLKTQKSEMRDFICSVLDPLAWSGFLVETREGEGATQLRHYVKTALWKKTLRLESDHMLTKPTMN